MKKVALFIVSLILFFGVLFIAEAGLPAPSLSSSGSIVTAGDSFTLSWAIPAEIPENTVIYYQLYLTNKDGQTKKSITNTTKETSYKIFTEKAYWSSETRYYKVYARGTSIENNGWSNIIAIKIKPRVPQLSTSAVSAFPDEEYILSWTSIPNAKRYYLYESQDPSFSSYTKIKEGCFWGCDKKKIRSQSSEGTYYYKVKACKFTGLSYKCSSNSSNIVSVTVAKGQGETVTPPSFSPLNFSINSGDSFTLKWDTPSEIPGQTTYKLCSTDANGQKCDNLIKTDKISYAVSTKPIYWSKETKYYKVLAIVRGVESGWSRVATIDIKPIAPVFKIKTSKINPAQYKEKVNVGSGKSYTLSWNAISETGYYQLIIKNSDTNQQQFLGLSVNLTQKSYSYKTFSNKNYCYKLRALKTSGESTAWSKEICVKITPATLTFTAPQTVTSNEKFTIKWTCSDCPKVEKYIFYEDSDSSFNSANTQTFQCYQVSWGWGGYTKKKIQCEEAKSRRHRLPGAYFYKVEACDDEENCFVLLPSANFITIQAPQFAISPKSIKAGNSYKVSWSKISGAQKYELATGKISGECPDKNCQIGTAALTSAKFTPFYFPIISKAVNFYHMLRIDYGGGEYSIWSGEKKVEVKPNTPSPLTINPNSVASGEKFVLKWLIVPRADKYEICYSEKKGDCQKAGSDAVNNVYPKETFKKSSNGKQYLFSRTKTSFIGKTFYYQIQAIGTKPSTGEEVKSPWSNESSVTLKGVEVGLTPNSPFYFLDGLLEKTRLLFTVNPEKKANLAMNYAQEKLAEAEAMSIKNKPKGINKASGHYEKYINLAIDKIGQIKDETKKEELVIKANKNIIEQQVGLSELKKQVSEDNKESVQSALEISVKVLERGLKIIPEKDIELESMVPLDAPTKVEIPKAEDKEIRITPGIPKELSEPEPEPAAPEGGEPRPEDPGREPEPEPEPECTSNIDCNDNKVCTKDICTNNSCQHQCLTDQGCDDGNVLTINDICKQQAGKCICKGETVKCYNDNNCNDNNACTVDTCHNSRTTDAYCGHAVIDSCDNNDGCCPETCNSTNDNDCNPVCGNEICETGETYSNCSSDCEEPEPESEIECCPETEDADCEDDNPCTDWICEAEYGDDWEIIRSHCELYYTTTECYQSSDGCCPEGCTHATDPDCAE